MKNFNTHLTILTIALMVPSIALAQRPIATSPAGVGNTGNLDPRTNGSNVRVSQLIGLNIQNLKGENVGEINDLVVDSATGRVNYAAVTYGGLLGVGDKMFAVPFEAFTVMRNPEDPNDADDYVMVLDVSAQQMEGLQGFDQENWPNFADRNVVRDLEKRYRIDQIRDRNLNGRRGINVDVSPRGVDVDINRN